MTQIIEKLAEVLAPDAFCIGGEKSKKDWAIQKARAILHHLRDDPTPEMIEAGEIYAPGLRSTRKCFEAILNTALGEE